MIPKFNKAEWTTKLMGEIGLSHVPYEELHLHFVETGAFGDYGRQTAKEYVDAQLLQVENFYSDTVAEGVTNITTTTPLMHNLNEELQLISGALSDVVEPDEETDYDNVPQSFGLLTAVEQSVDNVMCFDVVVKDRPFIVAINHDTRDYRSRDQIRHILNTTFFVERRDITTILDTDNVISYYQFINMILLPTDISIADKIRENITTEFDGPTVPGF